MDRIQQQLLTGYPLLRVVSLEEDSAEQAVVAAARSLLGEQVSVFTWDAAQGLVPARPGADTLDTVLDLIAADPGPTVVILRDAGRFLEEAVATRRRLFRLVNAIGARPVRVVILSPPAQLDDELSHRLPTVNHALPSLAILKGVVTDELGSSLPDATPLPLLAAALRGLTLIEARATLRAALASDAAGPRLLERLFEAKARRIEGQALTYHPPSIRLDDVGGLKMLKEWAALWARHYRDPETSTADSPRGVLLTGISGCGKSLAIKALSHAMSLPLFRLDMAQVFARRNAESAYSAAIAAVEALAPCIVWIDEIENALALGTQDSGSASRIAGGFLTWMQERAPGVFLAATANRVELLPAELLRRGRFDQILFVDLPDDDERKRIWTVHLGRRGLNPARFDLIVLSRSTDGWSGAEIEAAVEAACVRSGGEASSVNRDELLRSIGKTIPLSVTMQEQIRRIREWAFKRALPASGKPW